MLNCLNFKLGVFLGILKVTMEDTMKTQLSTVQKCGVNKYKNGLEMAFIKNKLREQYYNNKKQ